MSDEHEYEDDDEEMYDCTPDAHLIEALQNQVIPWWKCLAEMVDNSFDAGATHVLIRVGNGCIEVIDDGHGFQNMRTALKPGSHTAGSKTRLGMYGIGLKDAWFTTGRFIEIVSRHKGVERKLVADAEAMKTTDWHIPPAKKRPSNQPSGTSIKITFKKGKHKPQDPAFKRLQWAFTPALQSGLQIVTQMSNGRKKPMTPLQLPEFDEHIEDSFDINGKTVYFKIGIVPQGESFYCGPIWIQYGHRNIKECSVGCGSYNTSRIGGVVRLGSGWRLSKNKDDVEDFRNELSDAIFQRIEPILKTAGGLVEEYESTAFRLQLEELLNQSIRGAKADAKREARQSLRESIGSIMPKLTGRRRKTAEKVHEDKPGSVETTSTARKTGFHIGTREMIDDDRVGVYDIMSNRVDLNAAHPFIKECMQDQNKNALHAVAVAIIAEYAATHDGHQKLMYFSGDFSETFGKIMKKNGVQK